MLESQPSVETKEEHEKERNRNYKWKSWGQLATIDGNVKSLLLPMSRSTQSTSSDNFHLIQTNKGETCLVSIIAWSFVLQLTSSLQGYKVEFQQKMVEKMFIHDVMKPLLPTYLSNVQDAKKSSKHWKC